MLRARGKVTESRIDYALKNSTIDYLKEALKVINEMPEIVRFDYLNKDELLFTVVFNIKTGAVINYECFTEKFELWQCEGPKGLLQVLDFLCSHTDREYMNSRNLITKIKQLKCMEVPNGPYFNSFWIRFMEDKSLQFKDLAFDFEL